jgi:hypothetical protein
MCASDSLVDHIEVSDPRGLTGEARRNVAERDQSFLGNADHFSDEQVELFDAVLSQLIKQVEQYSR